MSLCDTAVRTAQEMSCAEAVESAPPPQTGHATQQKATKLVWHYTDNQSFLRILNDGIIRPATAYVPAGELPITWFSTEQFWEPTVIKGKYLPDETIKGLGMAGMLAANVRLYRFGVDAATAPYRWSQLKDLSGMHPEIAAALAADTKRRGGSPNRWRGTFDPVSSEKWVAIEAFENGKWVPVLN